jgi:lysophospholipid acyltransferase (LPLAT)-like uncharacterized protein
MPRPSRFPLSFDLMAGILTVLVPWLLRLWFWTIRITLLRPEIQREWLAPGRNAVGALWHQNFLFYAWYFRHRGYVVLSSRSKDGEIMVRVMRPLGYRHVRGSSSRGGKEAVHELVQHLREGRTAAIIADGPRGPARVAKHGVAIAARHSGIPVIPAGAYCCRAKRLRSWDRSALPLPFSRIVLAFGEPIHVPPDIDQAGVERYRLVIQEAVTRAEREAEAHGVRTSFKPEKKGAQ